MTPLAKNARLAGFFYLLLLFAPLRLIYIPTKLFVTGDATATAGNIAAHEMPFRYGIAGDLWVGTMTLFMTAAFYRLFKSVDRNLSIGVVVLGGILPCAIYFFNVMNDFAGLVVIKGGDWLSAFTPAQQSALAYLFIKIHGQEILAAEVFWGLWLLPLGWLVIKSRWMPAFLGWWLLVNGLTYLVLSVSGILAPDIEAKLEDYVFPIQFGELAFMLWLLLMGAKEPAKAKA